MGKTLSPHENPLDILSEIHCQSCLLLHPSGAAVLDDSAWTLVFAGIRSQNIMVGKLLLSLFCHLTFQYFICKLSMSITKKNVFEKISILQSVILNVDFLLQLFNSASSASVFYT